MVVKTMFNTEIPATGKRSFAFDPGVPVYNVVVKNQDHHDMLASVTYNRDNGELVVTVLTKGM